MSVVRTESKWKTGALASTTLAAVGTVDLGGIATSITFTLISLVTETIACTVSVDGTNFSGAIKPLDVVTGVAAAAVTLANGTYTVNGNFTHIKFTKSATTSACAVTYAATF